MPSSKKLFNVLTLVSMLCLYSYVLIKAWLVPITYDEAYTIDIYAQMPVADIMFSPKAFDVANNHILNTLFTHLLLKFGAHPFLLRLPAILAYSLFLYAAYHISRRWFQNSAMAFACCLCLALNPMLSEFFALCRGYAMGIGFMMMALLQLTKIALEEEPQSHKPFYWCGFAVILSTYSTVSFLVPSLCILGVLTILRFQSLNKLPFLKRLALSSCIPAVTVAIIAALIYLPVKHMLAANALFHGGRNNFISDTWMTMISDLIGGRPHEFAAFDSGIYGSPWLKGWTIFSLLILVAASLFISYHLAKKKLNNHRIELIPLILIWGCIIVVNAQFYLAGTFFVNYRVALYFYPLLVLLVFAAIRIFFRNEWKITLACTLAIALLINFLTQLKTAYTTEWPFDAYSEDVCKVIANDTKSDTRPAALYAHQLLLPALNFYIIHNYQGELLPAHFSDSLLTVQAKEHACYLYFPKAFLKETPPDFRLLKAYEDSTYLLFKRF